jgi:hypothetical protein
MMKLWVSFATTLLGLFIGCNSEKPEEKTSLFEDDHVVAEHWPNDLADTAVKLRERLSDSEIDSESRHEIEDLVSWTSEIAADTNLSEADWLPIYNASEALMTSLHSSQNKMSPDDQTQIESLCKLIDSAVSKISEQSASVKGDTP